MRHKSLTQWDSFQMPTAETVELTEATTDRGWWKLFQGDCLDVLSLLPDESANCVVTSPPYYWQRDYGMPTQLGQEASIAEYVNNLRTVFREVRRVIAKDGTVFLNLGDTYYSAKGQPVGNDRKHKARRFGLRAVDGPGLGIPR